MANEPYPGYPPSYRVVDSVGGFSRTCLAVEFLSLGRLEPAQLAIVTEQLEATVAKLRDSVTTIKAGELITPDRFDPLLRQGLRLPGG